MQGMQPILKIPDFDVKRTFSMSNETIFLQPPKNLIIDLIALDTKTTLLQK